MLYVRRCLFEKKLFSRSLHVRKNTVCAATRQSHVVTLELDVYLSMPTTTRLCDIKQQLVRSDFLNFANSMLIAVIMQKCAIKNQLFVYSITIKSIYPLFQNLTNFFNLLIRCFSRAEMDGQCQLVIWLCRHGERLDATVGVSQWSLASKRVSSSENILTPAHSCSVSAMGYAINAYRN